MRTNTTFLVLAGALVLSACSRETPSAGPAPGVEPAPSTEATAPAEAVEPYEGPPAEVTIEPVGEEMRYATTEFTVAPGQVVNLTFNNTATSEAMRHNVVVLRPGTDINAFGQAAMTATDNDYIPSDLASAIVAHTAMSNPGQTVEVTFTAPTVPGDYPFICTFPGHYMMMQGVMRVEA